MLPRRAFAFDHGKLLAEGTLDELKQMVGEEEVVTVSGSFDSEQVHERLASVEGLRLLSKDDGRLVLATSAGKSVQLLTAIFQQELQVDGVAIQPPSLNSLFIKLTGRELRD